MNQNSVLSAVQDVFRIEKVLRGDYKKKLASIGEMERLW